MNLNPKRWNVTHIFDYIEKAINAICVIFLTLQVIAIIVMVFGRYIFKSVPRGVEEFSLFCMVWFSLLSISLSIRDDSHVKMEILDVFISKDRIKYFQYFSAIMTLVFSAGMVVYGSQLVQLTSSVSMSGMQISEGWLFLSIPISGICMGASSIVFIIEKIRESRHGK